MLVEKDKAIRLSEVKLREMYALQKPMLADTNAANEVHDLLFKEDANFSGNYLKLRQLGNGLPRYKSLSGNELKNTILATKRYDSSM